MISGKSEFDKVLPSIRVEDFIQKPFSIAELKNTVLKHTGNTKRITSYHFDCIRK
jgi:DNA-binding response OmpR family regulator